MFIDLALVRSAQFLATTAKKQAVGVGVSVGFMHEYTCFKIQSATDCQGCPLLFALSLH